MKKIGMKRKQRLLPLFEALELRAEYDARVQTIKDCLPETRKNRDRGFLMRDDDSVQKPSPGFDVTEARQALKHLEFKRRKLNTAIQEANFRVTIMTEGDSVSLAEALEARKALNERIGDLHAQVRASAYQKIIYKEGRDILQESPVPYPESVGQLDDARKAFRLLNRAIRRAAYETAIHFNDE
jgi:hypothetical protein